MENYLLIFIETNEQYKLINTSRSIRLARAVAEVYRSCSYIKKNLGMGKRKRKGNLIQGKIIRKKNNSLQVLLIYLKKTIGKRRRKGNFIRGKKERESKIKDLLISIKTPLIVNQSYIKSTRHYLSKGSNLGQMPTDKKPPDKRPLHKNQKKNPGAGLFSRIGGP